MDVAGDIGLGEGEQIRVGERLRGFDLSVERKRPVRGSQLARHRSGGGRAISR